MIDIGTTIAVRRTDAAVKRPNNRSGDDIEGHRLRRNMSAFSVRRKIVRESTINDIW